ncbi:MAG: FAD-dependent oxidoreductase [Cyclobacteriaceae bacterium]
MKRRDFFKKGATGAVAATMIPLASDAQPNPESIGDRKTDKWLKISNGEMGIPNRQKTVDFDVAVLGGGVAGCCAAVSAARNGAKTVLVQDRPVLGGNSSSEIRVHMNGVTHLKGGYPERETGIVEEILLHNRFNNPQQSFHVWDHVIYDYVTSEPNLTVMMNTQAIRAEMKGKKINSALCWQSTTETEFTINAKIFIDCSGDGLLAATAGALYRTGREGKKEFNEQYAPDEPDGWQMGATIMFNSKDMGEPMPFEAPAFTIPYVEKDQPHKHRKIKSIEQGYWWVEVGSQEDIIGEFEGIRHKLMGYAYGVWDYIKNSGKFPEAENYALDWVCSFPGRRESRRFIGDHILSEGDLVNYRHFEDAVGYGGWSLDEHNPGGIENLDDPPSFFHHHFSQAYEIPFRSLYSANVPNLLFAGRNVSVTHIALSSTRLQGTCATMGQAVGTAAALCHKKDVLPRELATSHIGELQEQLLRDDAYIPNRPSKDTKEMAKTAAAIFASTTSSGSADLLIDGYSRDVQEKDAIHHWQSDGLPASVTFEWRQPVDLSTVEIKCDTNTRRNIMLRHDSRVNETFGITVPPELLKTLELEGRVKGKWVSLGKKEENKRRLIKFDFDPVQLTAIRVTVKETYGAENGRLYEVRCYA